MPLIDIQRAEPGTVLAADVQDRRGNPLLRAGVALTEPHIRSLSMWGVRVIEVEGEERPDDFLAEMDEETVAAGQSWVADLFRGVGAPEHPFIVQLKRVALEGWLQRQAGEV